MIKNLTIETDKIYNIKDYKKYDFLQRKVAEMNEPITCNYKLGKTTINPTNEYVERNIQLLEAKFTFIEEGKMLLTVGDKKFDLQKGDMVLIPPMVKHSYTIPKSDVTILHWFHFELKHNKNNFSDYLNLKNFPYFVSNADEKFVVKECKELFSSHKLAEPMSNYAAISSILRIITYYFSMCDLAKKNSVNDELDDIIEYIKNNLTVNFSCNELAKMANYSQNRFINKFRERTGYTPIQYINLLRIENARSLLYHSEDNISVIMEKCGFMDYAYFSKLFKKHVGSSPKNFREQLRH